MKLPTYSWFDPLLKAAEGGYNAIIMVGLIGLMVWAATHFSANTAGLSLFLIACGVALFYVHKLLL